MSNTYRGSKVIYIRGVPLTKEDRVYLTCSDEVDMLVKHDHLHWMCSDDEYSLAKQKHA